MVWATGLEMTGNTFYFLMGLLIFAIVLVFMIIFEFKPIINKIKRIINKLKIAVWNWVDSE